jgi:acetyltransferase-like isoleucine patch superfamily enzyme
MIYYYFYKATQKLFAFGSLFIDRIMCSLILKGNNVKYFNYKSSGYPYIMVALGGCFAIGKNFSMNNGIKGNPIGCYDRCTFFIDRGAKLTIGNNVGISQTALICHTSITIGNNVKIGGGVKIYDTDFHSLDPIVRASKADFQHKTKVPVVIKDNAFIGAYSIILKGVIVGRNSIIGAGSIVTKSVPDNQIWAGNPAKFVKEI